MKPKEEKKSLIFFNFALVKMLRDIFFMLMCLLSTGTFAQSQKVPPFRIIQADGKVFMAQNLPMGKPIVIIYFSPECEECQKLTSGLLSRIDEFRDVSFAMITYLPGEKVTGYIKKNYLDKYENIFAGTEFPTLFVRDYFNIMHFPYMVLFNKNGDVIKKYSEKEINLDDLLDRVKQLK